MNNWIKISTVLVTVVPVDSLRSNFYNVKAQPSTKCLCLDQTNPSVSRQAGVNVVLAKLICTIFTAEDKCLEKKPFCILFYHIVRESLFHSSLYEEVSFVYK